MLLPCFFFRVRCGRARPLSFQPWNHSSLGARYTVSSEYRHVDLQLWNIKPYTSTPLVLLRYLRMPTTKLTSAAFSPGEKGLPAFRNCHRNYAPFYSLLRYRLRRVWHPKKARLRCMHSKPPRIEACHLGESIDYPTPQLSWPDWVFGFPTTKSIEMPSQDLFGTGMDTLLLPLFSSWQRRKAP